MFALGFIIAFWLCVFVSSSAEGKRLNKEYRQRQNGE